MKTAMKMIVILLGIGLLGQSAFAQEMTEKEKKFEPTVKPFFWGWYTISKTMYTDDEDDNPNKLISPMTFGFNKARFGIMGKLDPHIGYHLMIEGIAGSGFAAGNVYQAWVDYTYFDFAQIRVGQFKYPFGMEAYPGFIKWKFINPSSVTSGIVGKLGKEGGILRDIGVQVSGDFKMSEELGLFYKAMLANGNGVLNTDNNDGKAIILNGGVNFTKMLKVFGSYYMGSNGAALAEDVDTYDENALNFGATVNLDLVGMKTTFQGEYMMQTVGRVDPADADKTIDDESNGLYVYGTVMPLPNVEVGVRFDTFDRNTDVDDNEVTTTTIMAGYYLANDNRILFNYELIDDKSSPLTTGRVYLLFQIAL